MVKSLTLIFLRKNYLFLSENIIKELVIYDLDGTLVDSAITVTKILNTMRQTRGLPVLDKKFVRPLTALGGNKMIKMALQCENGDIDRLLLEFRGMYSQAKIGQETIFDEVLETLEIIKRHGCLLSICTNKPRHLAIKTLEDLKLRSFFDAELCGGDIQNLKPAPDPLLELTRKFNINTKNCCFIGDTVVDYVAAKKSEIDFVYYDSGYDEHLNDLYKPVRITRHREALPYILSDQRITSVFREGESNEGR